MVNRPTDEELESMAVDLVFFQPGETSELAAAMLRACKTGDAPDQGEWDAAIEAAAKVADVKPRKGGKPLSGTHHQGVRDGRAEAARLIRTLKKGQTND